MTRQLLAETAAEILKALEAKTIVLDDALDQVRSAADEYAEIEAMGRAVVADDPVSFRICGRDFDCRMKPADGTLKALVERRSTVAEFMQAVLTEASWERFRSLVENPDAPTPHECRAILDDLFEAFASRGCT